MLSALFLCFWQKVWEGSLQGTSRMCLQDAVNLQAELSSATNHACLGSLLLQCHVAAWDCSPSPNQLSQCSHAEHTA